MLESSVSCDNDTAEADERSFASTSIERTVTPKERLLMSQNGPKSKRTLNNDDCVASTLGVQGRAQIEYVRVGTTSRVRVRSSPNPTSLVNYNHSIWTPTNNIRLRASVEPAVGLGVGVVVGLGVGVVVGLVLQVVLT